MQVGYYFSLSFFSLFKKIIREKQCDLFISHLLRMVPYLIKCDLQEKSIIEMTDALSKTYSLSRQYKQFSVKKMVYIIEKELIAKYEQYVINNFKKICLISQQDINILGEKRNLKLYPPGIYCDKSGEKIYSANKICFIGNMRTLQNQDAVNYFINDIFPIIKQRLPKTVFVVIGAEPPAYIQRLSNDIDIFVTGFVNDIYEAISDVCVAVAPIRIAAGVQYKVLMAMGAHIPVVLTPLIAGGIPELISGENCFIAEEKRLFAESCIVLLTDKEKRKIIARNGYDIVNNNYSEEKMLRGYECF
jgi:glycosyltransferase involved in cell wall biosynthesis